VSKLWPALGLLTLADCASWRASPAAPAPEPSYGANAALQPGADDDLGGDADLRDLTRTSSSNPTALRPRLQAFLVRHPHHRQRPLAVAMLVSAMLATGDALAAQSELSEEGALLPNPESALLLGLAEGQLGHAAPALTLLHPYLAADPPGLPGLDASDCRARLRLTLAKALAARDEPGAAIDQLEMYQHVSPRSEATHALALRRAEIIASDASELSALRALGGRRSALALAMLGPKAVAALRSRGDERGVSRLDREVAGARKELGLELPSSQPLTADPLGLGLSVPWSGSRARLGRAILRGAMLALVAPAGTAAPAPWQLLVRDSAASPDRSGQGGPAGAIAALSRVEHTIGVVSTSDAAVELASADGLPLLLLDERPGRGGTSAFQMVHASEARAAALARAALALGERAFAVLGPDTPAGRRLAAAYEAAVRAGGGRVSGLVTYPAAATSFASAVTSLRKLTFTTLFIPDDANRLELIAPALAVADLWPRSPRATSVARASAGGGERAILLESTALGLSSKFLHDVERYVQGALFCPGFYPSDDLDNVSFVTHFRASYGALPSATDAYAYDAISLLRAAVERGARTRADVLRTLADQSFAGLTGDIRFGPDHERTDPPLIYVVEGTSLRTWK